MEGKKTSGTTDHSQSLALWDDGSQMSEQRLVLPALVLCLPAFLWLKQIYLVSRAWCKIPCLVYAWIPHIDHNSWPTIGSTVRTGKSTVGSWNWAGIVDRNMRNVGNRASEAWEEHRQQSLQWHLEPGHLPSQQALWMICSHWFGQELRCTAWEPPEQHTLIKQKETNTHLGGEPHSGLLSRSALSQEHSFLPSRICLTGPHQSQDSLRYINPKA